MILAKLLFTIVCVFIGASAQANTKAECAKHVVSTTDGLIAFLDQLTSLQIIREQGLSRLINGLKQGQFLNPVLEVDTWTNSAAMIHFQAIQKFLKNGDLDKARILKWALATLKEKGGVREEREQTSETINYDLYYKTKFNPVPAGDSVMGELYRPTHVKLTNPFEMMSTPVTQHMWAMLMNGKNPSRFSDGDDSISLKINGNWVIMNPDNPVERVTWWSAIVYANRMSELMGYKPAYDLSGVKFKPGTSAEDGTLAALEGSYKLNAPVDDIYQTEGYRLPTAAEVEYVLRRAGEAEGKFHFDPMGVGAYEYVWSSSNSENKTHPVAQLKPLKIGEYEFFDMPGHVWIWTHDSAEQKSSQYDPRDASPSRVSVDPQGSVVDSKNKVAAGGCFANALNQLEFHSTIHVNASVSSDGIGVRLVRTLPK